MMSRYDLMMLIGILPLAGCVLTGCDDTAPPSASAPLPAATQPAEATAADRSNLSDDLSPVGSGSTSTLGRARDSARSVIEEAQQKSQEIADEDWDW